MRVRRRTRRRRRRSLLGGVLAVVVLGACGWLALEWMARHGREFSEVGRGAVETLGRLAAALEAGEWEAAEASYGPGFEGVALGLDEPRPAGERDGVESFRFPGGEEAGGGASTGAARIDRNPIGREEALAGWRAYLAGFDAIEAIGLHLHRVDSWQPSGEVEARVRFELIGTRSGRARPGIDRALFSMRFEPAGGGGEGVGGGARIVEAAPLGGTRLLGDRAHFTEVGAAAGIDFVNRYYPPFLTEPLRFKMILHGPGGIAAADYDGDGFYDLFVPDGVESRLFRNTGDGTFEDVTDAAGLGGLDGVSTAVFADYDNDGRRDLFVSRTFSPNQLFRNLGPDGEGTVVFEDVTAASGIGEDCCTTVASWGDVDNDGLLDLYVGRYIDPRRDIPTGFYARNGEPNRLYRNLGGGPGRTHFEDVTERAGVGDPGLCLGSAFGDYDDDGDADLYVVNDFGRNTLYRNRGDGTFADVTVASGTLAYGAGMSAAFGDYDNDGLLDLYVANIRSEHGWFAEAPTVGRYVANSFRQGVWAADMPLFVELFRQSGTRFVEVFQQMASGNTLLRNRGPGSDGAVTFEDVTWAAGANPVGWFWGSSFGDLDNDGWLDLYSTNGWVYGRPGTELELEFLDAVVGDRQAYRSGRLFDPESFDGRSWHGYERNRHLRNDRRGGFEEIATPAGTDLVLNSRGVALADFWNRGVLDVAVAASDDRHALLRNEVGLGRHWLEVDLVGTRSNRDAIGARVVVRAGGETLTREVTAGDGYASQSMLRLHFGLGDAATVDELIVRWPASGTVQRFEDLAADRIVEITEGDELADRTAGAEAR